MEEVLRLAKLTPKQRRFVAEYLVDLNATQAAIRAGYSENRASEIGYQLLQKTTVRDSIQAAMEERERRTGVTQDWVVQELYRIAAADRGAFARVVTLRAGEDGRLPAQVVELTDTDTLTEDQRAALAGVEETKYGIRVNTYDKLKALELLGRHLGMFTDKVEQSGETTIRLELGAGLEELAK